MNTQNKQKDNRDLPTHIIVLTVACFLLALLLIFLPEKQPKVVFIPPSDEPMAREGIPETTADEGYRQIHTAGMHYTAMMCGNPRVGEKGLRLCFTNPEDNAVWLRLRLYDESGQIVGETGILRPGEYVESVPLAEGTNPAGPFTAEIMSYQPETYFSQGAVRVNIKGTAS